MQTANVTRVNAAAMSVYPPGKLPVRRSGFGAMQLAGQWAAPDRGAGPLLTECRERGIAFVPFCPLGLPRGPQNPVLTSQAVRQAAARLGVTAVQVALQWLLQLAPNVLLIPGTGSVAHLQQNLAAEHITLDEQALGDLEGSPQRDSAWNAAENR